MGRKASWAKKVRGQFIPSYSPRNTNPLLPARCPRHHLGSPPRLLLGVRSPPVLELSPHRHRSPHHDRSHPKRLVLRRPPLPLPTHPHCRIPHTPYASGGQARPPPRGLPRPAARVLIPHIHDLAGFRAARRRVRRTSTRRVDRRIGGSRWAMR